MFFPDRVRGYRETRRALRRGGTFAFNVWDRISENAFANDVTDTLAEVFPDDPPRFLARTPHGYCYEALIKEELVLAVFVHVAIDSGKLQAATECTTVVIASRHGKGEVTGKIQGFAVTATT